MSKRSEDTSGAESGKTVDVDLEGVPFGDRVAMVAIGSLPVEVALGSKFTIGEDKLLRQEWTGPAFDVLAGLVVARK